MAGSKPDWNAGLVPKPKPLDVSAAVDNPYLDAAYMMDKEQHKSYAERYLLGQWVTPKLEPCPFCGSSRAEPQPNKRQSYVECANCGAAGPTSPSTEEAVRNWNTRQDKA